MFSIVTPVYNGITYIKKAVGSVKAQYGVPREHIIFDGVSSDGSAQYVEELSKCRTENAYDDCYAIHAYSEKDDGMYDAINKGWEKATGQYLSWLNSDEQYLPGTLEYVATVFDQNPDVDVLYGNAIMVDKDGGLIAARKELPLSYLFVSNAHLNIFSCTIFFRRRLWDKGILKLDRALKYAADMDLILRLMKADTKMMHLEKYLSLFTVDGNHLSTHSGMKNETVGLRERYGSLPRYLRRGVRMLRYAQRLLSGHYQSNQVKYFYAEDDKPSYRTVDGVSKGTFSFK